MRSCSLQRGADAVLKMILEDGFFHADPHPGNVIYLPGNRIAMIDFGMVGRLSPTRRNQIVDLLAGIARHDEQPMLEVLLDWAGDDAVDEERARRRCRRARDRLRRRALKDMRVGALIAPHHAIVRDHGIVMPADLTLMFKALITLEGLGRKYDPEFRLADRLRPFLDRAIAARYAPVELGRRGGANLGQLLRAARLGAARSRAAAEGCAPRPHASRSRSEAARQLRPQARRTIDRITIGIMTASLVIGSSIVMTVTSGPQVFGMPLFTVLGSWAICWRSSTASGSWSRSGGRNGADAGSSE